MEHEIRWIKTKDLQADPVANELANSEAMRPYMDYHVAALSNDPQAAQNAVAIIKGLPVEKRYIWRVVSTLKWALADFDSNTLKLDLPHLPEGRRLEIIQELQIRLYQLNKMVRTVMGQ